MSVVDLDPIPLADTDDENTAPASRCRYRTRDGERTIGPCAVEMPGDVVATALIVVLCSLHGRAIWLGMGGLRGLTNGWPLVARRPPALLP